MFFQPLLPLQLYPHSILFNEPVQEFSFDLVRNIFIFDRSSLPHIFRNHDRRVSRLIKFSNPIVQLNAQPIVFLQFLEECFFYLAVSRLVVASQRSFEFKLAFNGINLGPELF